MNEEWLPIAVAQMLRIPRAKHGATPDTSMLVILAYGRSKIMSDLIVNIAVIGRAQMMPGILPVTVENPHVKCLVTHGFPPCMEDIRRGIKIDTTDCTVFSVSHCDQGDVDLTVASNVQLVFEQSLAAISEACIWTKAADQVGGMSSFIRQIGTTDVKAFFAVSPNDCVVGWFSPAFTFNRNAAGQMAGLLSNMVFSNGPSANPVPPITRRVMSSLDLINLGFYTESFVNLFSLVDDLTQEVIKAGMTKQGLNEDEQKGLLRAIKEERLKVYLCNLAKLCNWQSLEEAQKELFDKVLKVNSTRNKIMHGSRRLLRTETMEAIDVLLQLISWLRSNPFGFQIPMFPLLRVAQPEFLIFPVKSENAEQSVAPLNANE